MCALGWFNNGGLVKCLSLYNVHATCCGLTMTIIREVYNKDTLCERLPDDGHGTVVKCRTHCKVTNVFCYLCSLLCSHLIKCCKIRILQGTWQKLNILTHI